MDGPTIESRHLSHFTDFQDFRIQSKAYTGRELPPLALFHGFASSHRTWNLLLPFVLDHFNVLLPDLPCHGGSETPRVPLTLMQLAGRLDRVLHKFTASPKWLCGYSMGGRVALHCALNNSASVRGLILLGASPGISEHADRAARAAADQQLAQELLTNGIEWFVNHWENLPIFASQASLPDETKAAIRQERLACKPAALAYALRHWSTGVQADLTERLQEIQCPVLLLAGAQDPKFVQSNQSIAERLGGPCECHTIPHSGHAAQLEQPRATAEAILAFVSKHNQ